MKAEPTFCRNNSGLIEHIKIELKAETEKDTEDLDLLCQTGVVASSTKTFGRVFSAVLYRPAEKEVYIS